MLRTRAIAFTAVLALIATGAYAPVAHATPQADLASEQQRAEQLQAEIEANGNRVSILDERYLTTQLAIQRATDQLNADQARVEEKARETDRLRELLADRAAELYMDAGNPTPLAGFDVTSPQALGSRSAYSAAAADQDHQLLDNARVAIEDLGVQQRALADARARAEAESNRLETTRRQITAATAQQEELLGQVNGRIKTLVDEIQAEKERAAQAAARASMERLAREQAAERAQAAADAAARQESTTSRSSDGGSTTTATGSGSSPTTVPPQDLPAPSSHAQVAVDTAEAQLGKPYVYAAAGPDSFDCSGLTMYAWAAAGVSLPHNAEAQYNSLPHVPMDALEPGDLVFFGNPIHHVGMFVGNGTMIEAPYTGVNVRYHSIYRDDFAGAARP
jgi:cell wall-associated NlpC family hydrolase